jgi:hypothetical protein
MNEVLLLDKVTKTTTVNTESLAFHPLAQMATVVAIMVLGCLIITWVGSRTGKRRRKGRRKSTPKRTKRR